MHATTPKRCKFPLATLPLEAFVECFRLQNAKSNTYNCNKMCKCMLYIIKYKQIYTNPSQQLEAGMLIQIPKYNNESI